MRFMLRINGQRRSVDAPADMPLLWVLRDELNMVGTKFGCGIGSCGACTVLVAGEAVRSCQLPVEAVGKAAITTVEGLADSPLGAALQQVWHEKDVMQCGYCQAGQLMSACALLKTNAKPTGQDIDAAMTGNLCRCGCYDRIRDSILAVATAQEKAIA